MAGQLSRATREQIRAANDIVEVIGSYLPLKRAGANFVALCPFHKEKTPSFNVNPQRQVFNCFGCHAGGVLFIQGGKTYYNMPNGVRRKIADYEMDLNPSSPDMRQFTECMETARREHNAEERVKRVNAKREMVKVAKEVAHE